MINIQFKNTSKQSLMMNSLQSMNFGKISGKSYQQLNYGSGNNTQISSTDFINSNLNFTKKSQKHRNPLRVSITDNMRRNQSRRLFSL